VLRRAPFGIDVFEGTLEGLLPAEAEFDSAADAGAPTLPSSIWPEMSADNRFTGDSLSGRHERIFALRCWNTGSDSGEHTDPLPTEENALVAGVNCL
jgi:hypothetical protein